jgi:hypothetical protein
MAGIPKNFESISPVIGSYDWLDLTTGAGYIMLVQQILQLE